MRRLPNELGIIVGGCGAGSAALRSLDTVRRQTLERGSGFLAHGRAGDLPAEPGVGEQAVA